MGTGPRARGDGQVDASRGSGDALFGSGTFDADDFGDVAIDLALDGESHAGGPHSPASAAGEGVIERTAQGARSLPPRSARDERRWPSGVSPDSASIEIDAAEVALTAEYGPAPTSYVAALPYVAKVLLRKRVLHVRLREHDSRLVEAESARDELLTRMLEELRPELLCSNEGKKLLEPVTRIEAVADEKRSALTGANDEYSGRAAELDSESASVAAARQANARAVEIARATLAERRDAHERAEARMKRLYIEVRALLDAAEKSGGPMTAEQTGQLAACETNIAARKPELAVLQSAMDEAARTLDHVELEAKAVARTARDVARRRGILAAEAERQLGAHSQGVNEAEAQRAEAAVEAARSVLAARGRLGDVKPDMLDAISRADADVEKRTRDLERYVRALDSYDAEGMKKGRIAASALVGALVLVVLMLVRR